MSDRSGPTQLSTLVELFRRAGGVGDTPAPVQHDKSSSPHDTGQWTLWRDARGQWWAARKRALDTPSDEPTDADLEAAGLAREAPPAPGMLLAISGPPLLTQRLADGLTVMAAKRWPKTVLRVVSAGQAPPTHETLDRRGRVEWSLPQCDVLVITSVAEWLDADRVEHIAEACITRRQRTTLVLGQFGTGPAWRRLQGVVDDQGHKYTLGGQGRKHGQSAPW